MKALLIEFDATTGKRAGNINPRDPHLPCHGWQNLESVPALEIRLVEDDRDLSQYEGVLGVKILDGKDAINEAIKTNIPPLYKIIDMVLLTEHMKEKSISLDEFVGKSRAEIAVEAYNRGLAGVSMIEPRLVE